MARIRFPYIQEWKDAKTGIVFRYFRRPGFQRVRLPGLPGSTEFMVAYQAAMEDCPQPIGENLSMAGSVSAAIAAFSLSNDWNEKADGTPMADGTKAMRRAILERFRRKYGEFPLGKLHANFLTAYLVGLAAAGGAGWRSSRASSQRWGLSIRSPRRRLRAGRTVPLGPALSPS